MTFCLGLSTNSQTSFLVDLFNSSCMAKNQSGSSSACSTFQCSKVDTRNNIHKISNPRSSSNTLLYIAKDIVHGVVLLDDLPDSWMCHFFIIIKRIACGHPLSLI